MRILLRVDIPELRSQATNPGWFSLLAPIRSGPGSLQVFQGAGNRREDYDIHTRNAPKYFFTRGREMMIPRNDEQKAESCDRRGGDDLGFDIPI